ncbi:intermembrane lipid transfer protein VPS13A-like isoform X3 [Mercenaria mercenaria]|uniref:intermembrane lipid transfer protein VPS13A-like isoform X3 n=1 Tax=Mercenaria mercenaria TaxID=6596 RepID=UPI00234E715B|nr:intermembrane lipid transfer protein VPS13A-like isoform X3 [Mercenaria mercenaria]
MFESAVSYVLNRFLGKYIQNLDSSNLNVSIFKGDVELTDLQLRPEALVELKLPIEVKAGYVGYIKVDIPWTSLFSSSVVVHVEDVYLLAGPVTDRMYDPERERALQNAIKREALESLSTSTLNKVAASSEEDPGFFEKLYTYVVNNVQVSIGRVHLRYEDTVTNPDHPFACGIMLKHISAYTTDAKWQPAQMDNAATVIHKLLEMRELSVYWNPYIPEQHLIRSRINTDGWRNLLKQSILKHSIFEEDFDFIIEPVSAETRLIISKDNNSSMPKVFADVSLAEIDVLLSRQQFLNILNLKDSFQLMSVNQKYRKYHPNVPLKISPRSWWMYAYTAVVEERIRPYSWERIKEHRTKYRKYKELYKKSLESPNHESTKAKLWELEESLDVGNIVMAREQAKAEYAPEKLVKKKKEEKGWWASWFGSESEDEEVDIDFGEESTDWLSKLTPEEKEKLYQGIGYDENANIAMLPREYVEYKVQVNLKSCCLSLVNYSKKILQVSVTQMLGSWETRPAGDAYRISCHTESFTVEGASIEHELVPIVTSDVNVYAPSVNQVFTLDFESNPLYVDADFSLKTNIQPVEVVYDEHSVCEVRAFFQLPTGTIDVRTAAMETMQEVVRISQAGLIYAIEKHKTVHLAVNMKSPYVVIPEFGTLHRGGNVLIADLGMLQIKSELQPKDSSLEHGNLSDSEIASRLYDQFNITITDVKMLLADSGDDWHTAQVQPTSEYHILPSMKLMFDFYNTVKPEYKQLPQQKVITTLPSFEINISDKKLLLLWKFFRNFPLPSSTSISMLGEDMVDAGMSASYTTDPNEIQVEPDIRELREMKQRVLGRKVIIKSKKHPKSPRPSLSDEADNPYVDEGDMEDWVKYEDIKAVDDISSSHNTTNIVLRVVIREVVIQLSKSMDRVENPYLMFRAERLRLDAAITEHGVAAHASLGAIQLVDKIHVGTSGEYLELLSTKPGTDLVSVLYRKVEKECLDFEKIYHSVEQGLKCQFETLNILADQGAIMYLKAYIEGIQTSIHSTEMVTSVSTVLSSLVTDPSKTTTRQKSQPEDDTGTKPETNSSIVQWNIIFDLHDLSLVMADNNSKIAEIHIRDLKGHMLQRPDKLTLIGSLRDIDVKDCTHGALYPNILMLEDKEDSLFRFSFTKYSRRQSPVLDNRQIVPPFDYTINIRVGHLQFVALGKFYWEIMKFAEPLLSAEVLDTASVSMKAVTKQMDNFKQDNHRFGITVDMLTPTILIPVKSDSADLLLLKSGDLHVNNVFDFTDIGHGMKQEWNHIYVSLTCVQLSRAKLSQEEDAFLVTSSLLEPMTFQTDIRLALEPEMSDVQTDIACKLEKVNSFMSQKDCQVLFGVLRANWTEGAPLSEPEPVRRTPVTTQTSEESGTVVMDTDMTSSMAAKKTSTVVLFTLEGMELVLSQDTKEEGTVDFAKLVMGKISGTVNSRGDGETKVTVALETLYVLNIKPDSRHVVKKILYHDKESVEKETDSRRPLVSVIYKISGDGNQKADIMMEKVTINLQIPYILELSSFLTEALTSPVTIETPAGGGHTPVPAPPYSGSEEGPVMTVYFSMSQPEIVLLADPESHNSRIIVVNADIAFEYVANPTQQRMWSKIAGLKMFSSIYGAPADYQSKMITPCDLEFSRCYDIVKNELQMSVKLAKLFIHLTPPNMRLLMDVISILKQSSDQGTDVKVDDTEASVLDDMWKIKTVSPGRWIDKWNEEPATGPVFGPLDPPIEMLTLDIQEVCAFFEVENLDQTVPLLCVRTSVDGKFSNWTKQMRLTADLELDVCYYNEKLSVWEPLVEPNLVQEGLYEPWALKIQIFQAQSFPIVCSYDDNGLDVPDGLQSDVEQMINRNHFRSSSSENEADEELDSPSEMTILRPKNTRRKIRIASDKSYESLSRHSSVQGESDSESESLIHTITNKLGSIFTTDSSEDADVSETDDNDEGLDWTLDKPIFLTPQGPVKFRTGPERYDEIDGLPSAEIGEPEISSEDEGQCMYMIFSSPDKLMVNVTLPAINIIRDVLQSLDTANPDDLMDTRKIPALAVYNKLGVETDVILHKSVKIHKDYVHGCRICNPGDMRHMATPNHDDINVITEEEEEEDSASLSSQRRPLTFVNQTLADAGHTLISAGAFVFDDDVMVLELSLIEYGVQIQVAGFDTSSVQMMNRACRKLIHLTPKQSDELENEHGTKYYMVYDVDMNHSHKTVTLQSPLQLKNNLTMSVDVFVLKDEVQTYKRNTKLVPVKEDFMKLTTLSPQELFAIPLFAAYHCALYICPTDLPYEKTSTAIWWPDLVQTKDRQKYFSCKSQSDEKLFNIKVVCQEGEALRPPQMLTRTIPYFTITLHPPVVLHNYLPYDLQFSLQGSESTSSLTHGDSTPLYTVNMSQAYKLNLFVADYLTCDWRGTLDITQEMEEFKAISMDTDLDPDNNNKHLSLSVHCNHDKTWNFYIYSPYWIVNKTDLTFQIRGSMSDVALECLPSSYPQLFRYKKNKRKKAKLKVYESHWSHAFSMDTVGNCGVVECHDNQRRRKYIFMVQCQLSKLKLTKIITVLPFFLVVNSSGKPLRYMEENKATDLWFDLAVGQCSPFWPVTESYSMFVKYERSNVVSQHFPFKTFNNTLLRMENGTALCVSVSGGTQNPITIQFTDYDVGDAPVRVDNFCDDVFIKIHQKNQSQTTILSSNQSVLYTWDDPTAERTLMWNIYGRNKPNFPAALLKDGYDQVNLKLKSLKSSGTLDYVDAPDQSDSSPEDDTDETDGLMGKIDESLIGKTRSDKLVIFWVSYLDHQQRVLLFTQDERVAKGARKAHVQGIDIPHERGVIKMNEAEQASSVLFVSLDGICVSMINKAYEEVALLTLSSIPATWEVEVNNRWKMLNVELQTWLEDQWKNKQAHASLQEQFEADLSKMQMLKPYMGALRRSYSPGLWFNYRASQHHMSLHAKIQKVQLDNQLPDAYFPTVLHPCPTPVYVVRKKGQKPFIELGMMRRTVPENNVDTFRYLKLLVQEFNIKIDKGFMMSLYDVFANLLADEESESSKVQSDLIFTQRSLVDVASVMIQNRPNRIFFEYLRLSPLKMHISFSLNGTSHLSQENKPSLVSDIVDFFLSSVGATFTEMKDVELRMAYYEVKGMSLSWKQLSEQIQSHYTHQAIQQAYVLILGLDVLGNPYGLVKDFTQGFGDLFYEPFLDTVQGSDEFADSLVRGVHSMLGNTVGGAAGSVARITGSLGSALAAMSLDKNYKMKRRATMQQRPANLPLSLALAGRGFVMGVCLGLSGVVLDPIRGAQEEGVEGFFKGVGKGIMGLLTKPTGGVFDMVSMAFDGLQRASELESGVVHRMRKPRFINPYLGLRPYSVLQAVGANLLLNVNKGQYAKSDMYWAHAPLSPADRADVLLITTRNILLLQKHRCWGGWDIEWEVKVENILGFPAIVNNKLVFKVKPDETSVNIFTGGEQEICCDDKEMLRWIQQRIENLMKYKQR